MIENIKNETVAKNLKTIFIDTFKKMFDFKTRASKYDYWGFMLVNNIVGIAFIFLAFIGGMLGMVGLYFYFGIYILYVILQAIATLSLSVRRLHDTNRSGKLLFWFFAPLLILIIDVARKSSSGYQAETLPLSGNAIIFSSLFMVVLSIAFFVMMLKKGNTEENRFGKVVVENPNSNKLANICCLIYFLIAIISGALNAALDKDDADENIQANGVANGTAVQSDVVDVQNSKSKVNVTEPVAAEEDSVEKPNIPLHENAE